MADSRIGMWNDPRLLQGAAGIGASLSSLARDPSADPVAAGVTAMTQQRNEAQKQQALQLMQENIKNLPPLQRSMALAVLQSGDAGAINTLMEHLTKPIEVGKGGVAIDPLTYKPVYQNPNADGSQISFTTNPDGTISFNQGTGNTGSNQVTSGGLIRDTATGSSKGGGGANYINPKTGQVTSTLTPANVTQAQTSIQAAENVKPVIQDIIKNLPQFQSGWKRLAEKGEGFVNNWVPGANLDLPSQFAAGKVAVTKAPENLVKAYGLNVTNESLQRMEKVVEPYDGESEEGYTNRILKELEDIATRQAKQEGTVQTGIPLNQPVNNESPVNEKPANAKYSAGAYRIAKNLVLPSFPKTPEGIKQFNDWYVRQPRVTQEAIRIKLGG